MLTVRTISEITNQVETWFLKAQRVLPWRENRTPYRVWISEVMLQQTQVSKVIDYYNRFITRFPNVNELANASEDEVLSYWTGLGYYSRCRNLHKAAKVILNDHKGEFPTTFEQISALPGIGSYTTGAIASFAFNQIAPVVDGNIARVLSRVTTDATPIDSPRGKAHFESLSLRLAQKTKSPALFHEGLMEIGATLCHPRSPKCEACPIANLCAGHREQNATAFPVKGKKAAKKELHGVFAILADNEHVWLERNEETRLLKNLYAPPHVFVGAPTDAAEGLQNLAKKIGFAMPASPLAPISVVRQLTHRVFHLHGFRVQASPADFPHGKWMKRQELSKIGLSSAILALLSKVQLLGLLLVLTVGCAHRQPRNNQRTWTETNSREVSESSKRSFGNDSAMRKSVVDFANDALGKRQINAKSRYFRRDCSGSVRGIFEGAGFSLNAARGKARQSDTKTLYDYVEQNGEILTEDPIPGDLVFFHNTYDVNHDGRMNDEFSHVGIVTEVDENAITYVHFSHGRVIKSKMSEELRRRTRKSKGKTGLELFAGYGRLELTS